MLFGALGVPVEIGALRDEELVVLTVLLAEGTGKPEVPGTRDVDAVTVTVSEAEVEVVAGDVSDAEVVVAF